MSYLSAVALCVFAWLLSCLLSLCVFLHGYCHALSAVALCVSAWLLSCLLSLCVFLHGYCHALSAVALCVFAWLLSCLLSLSVFLPGYCPALMMYLSIYMYSKHFLLQQLLKKQSCLVESETLQTMHYYSKSAVGVIALWTQISVCTCHVSD